MKYDIIIIGSGLGGLTAGTKLSKEGKKVLVIEQHNRPGGCATTFTRGDFTLEVGLHEMDGPGPRDMKSRVFTDLDVFKNVEFIRVPEFYRFINEKYSVVIPHDPAIAIERLSALFPGEIAGIKAYFDQILNPKKKPAGTEVTDISVGDFLDSIIGDEDLKLILLGNLGVAGNKIVIDPTTGGLGYGLEYSYSVMERIRMAALTQEDDKLQIPMISNVGNEIWKCKEAGLSIEDAPTLGDPEKRGIMMESVAATCYLMAGSDVVILRHPESVKLVRSFIDRMVKGGTATDVHPVAKKFPLKEADLMAISPQPQTAVGKEEAPAKEKPAKAAAAPKKEEKPKAPAKPAEKVVELKPKAEEAKAKSEPDAKAKAEAEAKAKAEAEARAKAEAAATAKSEAEDKAKAEAQAKAKAEADAKAQAEAEARKKVEAAAKEKDELQALREKRAQEKAKAAAQGKEELQALQEKRAQEKETAAAERKAREEEKAAKRLAKEPETLVDRLAKNLDRIHRRI